LTTKNIGLLVNERLVNLPPTIAPYLHSQLPEDLEFTKGEPDITDPKEFNYDYLLVLSKFSVPNEIAQKKTAGSSYYIPSADERLYYRWEDDVFDKKAEVSFCFQSTFKEVAEDGTKSWI
jgi:hypothetical protein